MLSALGSPLSATALLEASRSATSRGTSRGPRAESRGRHVAVILLLLLTLGCNRDSGSEAQGPFAREMRDVLPKIEREVGQPFKQPPKVEQRSKDQVRAFLEQQFNESGTSRDLSGQEAAYKRLGAIPDTLDVRAFFVALLTEQIAGYYDPEADVLYVVEGMPAATTSLTLTHELIHALQDQYLDLDSLREIRGDNDRAIALGAMTEGQATYQQIRVMTPGADLSGVWDRAREALRQERASYPLMASAPLFIQETLIFPYLSGAEFAQRFSRLRPNASMYDSLPQSTEQVMHERAFFGARRDVPTAVNLGPVRATVVYENNLGEFETRLWLFTLLREQNLAVRGAMGWDGDRYAVVDLPQGEGLVWLSVWDSQFEAAEFYDLARQAASRRYPGASAGRSITVTTGEVAGRPVVVWTDVPRGAPAELLDLARVTLTER